MYLRLVTEKPVSLEYGISETQKIQIYTITMIDTLGNVMSNGLTPSVEYWRARELTHFFHQKHLRNEKLFVFLHH